MHAFQRISQVLVGLWLVSVTSANTFALTQPSVASSTSQVLLAQANLAPSNSSALKPLPVVPPAKTAPSKTEAPGVASKAAAVNAPAAQSKPFWQDLTPAQQQSLKPLAANWGTIGEGQKRKWLELSKNYPSLPAAEQNKLHSRMSEWASMSQQQRNQARLNFAESKTLSPGEKAANWKAYQALTPEEKQKLAARAPSAPAGATGAVKPVPSQKLANVPSTRKEPKSSEVAADHTTNASNAKIDNRTLLPISPSTSPASLAPQKP